MTNNQTALAQKIASNLHRAFEEYKKRQGIATNQVGQVTDRCACCNQLLPNPYTQEWLATQCGMTKAKLVHYFQGNRIPSIITLLTIAKALDSSIDDLVEGVTHSLLADLQQNVEKHWK